MKQACSVVAFCAICLTSLAALAENASLSLVRAEILAREGELPNAEVAAVNVLREEIAKRTGIRFKMASGAHGPVTIAITSRPGESLGGLTVPMREGENLPEQRPEGFRLFVQNLDVRKIVWIIGADGRGTLYGVGALLRNLTWGEGCADLPANLDIATAPMSPIRGHQLGFRTVANSWDAWDAAQYEQYIRELAFFGINSVENIPFHDERITPVMKVSRREMNRNISEICDRYGLDYWVWTPADFDLKDEKLRTAMLDQHEQHYRDCKTLTGVFFPGGDPGDNPPELVLPFLEDLSKRLLAVHPNARIWLSLQGFGKEQNQAVYDYLANTAPSWLGGICEGPSSPSIAELRNNIPAQYKLRMYPDVTHNKICQYAVVGWDQAFAITLGREAINPRPVHYAYIHNWFQPYCDGFITYSDGVHDDVNKTVWSAMGWNSTQSVRNVLKEYARVFFGPEVAEDAADGILALEKNWRGPLLPNGSVEGTLRTWQMLEEKSPQLETNWRWQMCVVRAYYDAFVRRRLIQETALEEEANTILAQARSRGSETVMLEAMQALTRLTSEPVAPELRARIVDLYDKLFRSIGLQSSVEKYFASGGERGASLDYLDVPLNNRWWLEDEFKAIRKLDGEDAKVARLETIATWECPGPGSLYDDVGNTAKSPRVQRSEETFANPAEGAFPEPTHWWLNEGKYRGRLSWLTTMDWPEAMVYEGLDPNAAYTVRLTGYGQSLLKVDGARVQPSVDGKEVGEFKEFAVPAEAVKDRKVVLTWDAPEDEATLPWRQKSRLAEVWLLRK